MELRNCPKCQQRVRVDPADFDRDIECPICRAVVAFEDRPDDDEDLDDDRPRRRSRGRDRDLDDLDDAGILRLARNAVRTPANGLFWTGVGGMALALLLGGGYFALGVVLKNQPPAKAKDDMPPEVVMVIGVVFGVLGLAYFGALSLCAHKMKQLRAPAWGYAAAILGIATIMLFGPCLPVTWAGMPFGIFAIIAMTKREVRDAIWINQRR